LAAAAERMTLVPSISVLSGIGLRQTAASARKQSLKKQQLLGWGCAQSLPAATGAWYGC
jgi:hypothetical protein